MKLPSGLCDTLMSCLRGRVAFMCSAYACISGDSALDIYFKTGGLVKRHLNTLLSRECITDIID